MISLDDALAIYAAQLAPLPTETISTLDALNRVLAEPALSADDLPRFDQSAMDGYALRAADVADAASDHPVRLPVIDTLAAGPHDELAALPADAAVRIFTGAPLPPGADCMIPQERATREGDLLVFAAPWPARCNIRWRGEESWSGTPLARAGQRIAPGLLASLVNAGVTRVAVRRRPRVRLITSGVEVRPHGSPLRPGEIVGSNGPLVTAMFTHWGDARPDHVHVLDDFEAVRSTLAAALDDADLVITTGGASVGDRDFLVRSAEALGVRTVFWKVAQKPGKPIYFGVFKGTNHATALLCLPGNPGAVLVGLLLHVRRALDTLEGAAETRPHWRRGRLEADVERDSRRERLLRMRVQVDADGGLRLQPLHGQDSHMLGNFGHANALVRVAAGESPCPAGQVLTWIPLA